MNATFNKAQSSGHRADGRKGLKRDRVGVKDHWDQKSAFIFYLND